MGLVFILHPPLPESSGLSASLLERDALHQFVPGLDEGSSSFSPKLGAQGVNVNASLGELGQPLVASGGHAGGKVAPISP
jgi:hypothetical protein